MKSTLVILYSALAIVFNPVIAHAEEKPDDSLISPPVNQSPGPEYAPESRLWQGIPSIERTEKGRIWAIWYSGGETEGDENYVVVIHSDDDGETWSAPVLVVDPPGKVRAYDPVLWIDPQKRLWVFWAQSYEWFDGRSGTWCIRCDNPDADRLKWSEPRRVANGIMMNRPCVAKNGEWMLCPAIWNRDPKLAGMDSERFSNVYVSTDKGESWTLRGGADVPERAFDEHMIVERGDGSFWMLVRTFYGIGQSVSTDGGRTWSPGSEWKHGPSARFHLRRLSSGSLLLVYHNSIMGKRNNLSAFISDDDGKIWTGGLLIDSRMDVSYPDAVEAADGRIYIIYDHSRSGDKEILMAVIREADIRAGEIVSDDARLRVLVDKAGDAQ